MSRYVIREGNVRGQGQYVGPKSDWANSHDRLHEGPDWRGVRAQSFVWDDDDDIDFAHKYARLVGGRVVKLVPKRKPHEDCLSLKKEPEKPTITKGQMCIVLATFLDRNASLGSVVAMTEAFEAAGFKVTP